MRIGTFSTISAVTTVALAATLGCSSSRSTPNVARSTTSSSVASVGTSVPPACTGGPGNPQAAGRESSPPGDIPDTQAYVTYSVPSKFSVQVPEGWSQTTSGDAFSFTDKLNAIDVSLRAAPTAPTVATAEANEVPVLRGQSSCPTGIRVSTAVRNSGTAILISFQQNSSPDPVTGKVYLNDVEQYLFWRTGSEAVVTLISPTGADNVDPWRKVTDSFRWAG